MVTGALVSFVSRRQCVLQHAILCAGGCAAVRATADQLALAGEQTQAKTVCVLSVLQSQHTGWQAANQEQCVERESCVVVQSLCLMVCGGLRGSSYGSTQKSPANPRRNEAWREPRAACVWRVGIVSRPCVLFLSSGCAFAGVLAMGSWGSAMCASTQHSTATSMHA